VAQTERGSATNNGRENKGQRKAKKGYVYGADKEIGPIGTFNGRKGTGEGKGEKKELARKAKPMPSGRKQGQERQRTVQLLSSSGGKRRGGKPRRRKTGKSASKKEQGGGKPECWGGIKN